MKHAKVSRAWRPMRASRRGGGKPHGHLSAFIFNFCMLVLPLASAAAVLVIGRDHLYAYEYSPAGARAISARVERLNGSLIQLDFDRQRQWDDLVAMELQAGDVYAARGFLLSGGGMLPPRMGEALDGIAADGDATVELAALDLLTPSTRMRYEAAIPLLSRESENARRPAPAPAANLGNEQDFELMARSILAEPETDSLQFILSGFHLGLAGNFSQRGAQGAAALLAASRREDYPENLGTQIQHLLQQAVPMDRFRERALASAQGDAAGAYANAATAFRSAVNPDAAQRARAILEEIGAMSQAVSPGAAVNLVTHARSIRDLPRLRLLAQATGARAAAAAKRLPRDGRLVQAARGDLSMNRDLVTALTVMALSLFGLIAVLAFKLYQIVRGWLTRSSDEDEYESDLVDMGSSASNWRPL